jgi:hypothetical protein
MTMTSEDFDRMYGSKYLGAPDVSDGLRLRIGKVETADLREKDGNTKRRIVIWFEGQDKGLVINKTNAIKLADAYGKNSAAWLYQVVELYTEMTGLGKPGVRVRPLRQQSPQVFAPPPQPPPAPPPPSAAPPPQSLPQVASPLAPSNVTVLPQQPQRPIAAERIDDALNDFIPF